jgi:hypothetical protein
MAERQISLHHTPSVAAPADLCHVQPTLSKRRPPLAQYMIHAARFSLSAAMKKIGFF